MGGLDEAEILRTALRVAPNVRPIVVISSHSNIGPGYKTTKVFNLDITSTSTSTCTSTCASSTSTRSSVGPGYRTANAKVFDLDMMMGVKRSTGHPPTHTDREQHPRHRHTRTRQEQHSKPSNEHLPQTLSNARRWCDDGACLTRGICRLLLKNYSSVAASKRPPLFLFCCPGRLLPAQFFRQMV